MTPRPLYRWKSFWLGILVLVFLGWAAFDSGRYETQLNFFEDGLVFVHSQQELRIYYRGDFLGSDDWLYYYGERTWLPDLGESPWERWDETAHYGYRSLKLKFFHWLLILLFLVPWAGFLVWRVRRVKRLAADPEMDRDG